MPHTVLHSLQKASNLALDTAEFDAFSQYPLSDATTNPSLIAAAIKIPSYKHLLEKTNEFIDKKKSSPFETLLAIFAQDLLSKITGFVSIQMDPRCNTKEKIITQTIHFLSLCKELGLDTKRILIKIIATWEGIEAIRILERSHIPCNATVIVSLVQALACADARATMIACYVSRVEQWHIKNNPTYTPSLKTHHGILLVKEIFKELKARESPTKIMAASFRSKEEILALSGSDYITISPQRATELLQTEDMILPSMPLASYQIAQENISEKIFRQTLSRLPMASTVLQQAIEQFIGDTIAVENDIFKFKSITT